MAVLVGGAAPDFIANAVVDQKIVSNFTLSQFVGKYVILFFYPLDFTFVCPTELHAFQDRLADFEKRNTQLIGCSIDSCYTHLAWLQTPKSRGGIEGVTYPLVSDIHKTIAKNYGVLNSQQGIAYRGLFLIDAEGVVRHQVVNDLPLGRSVDEVLRTLDAYIYVTQHGEVCPANWKEGERGMHPSHEGVLKYFTKKSI